MMSKNILLKFLGTANAVPQNHHYTSISLEFGSIHVLVDPNELAIHQRYREKPLIILITHMHMDHISGLLPLLNHLALLKREAPVFLMGPQRIQQFIEQSLAILPISLTYSISYIQSNNMFNITKFPVDHGDIEAYGFEITLKKRDIDRTIMTKYNLSSKDVAMIAQGNTVKGVSRNLLFHTSKFSILISGDTAKSSEVFTRAKDARIIIHECTYPSTAESKVHSNTNVLKELRAVTDAKIFAVHLSERYRAQIVNELRDIAIVPEENKVYSL